MDAGTALESPAELPLVDTSGLVDTAVIAADGARVALGMAVGRALGVATIAAGSAVSAALLARAVGEAQR